LSDQHPNILHIGNTAGVARTLAKWTNKTYGWNTDVYAMKKHDVFGHIACGKAWLGTDVGFRSHVFQDILGFDVVHLHEFDRFIYGIRKRYPEKPIVIHYHGTDIRGRWNRKRKRWDIADVVLVSAPNLLEGAPEKAKYLPNPIDPNFFYPSPKPHEVDSNSALTFSHGAVDVAEELAEKYGLKLHIHHRDKKFIEMPHLLRQFSWYIDVKRSRGGVLLCRRGGSGSMTGLEALACGLKVINSDGEIREGLPSQHWAENVVKILHPIYMILMESVDSRKRVARTR